MATLQEFVAEVVGSIAEMGPKFQPVATQDPLSAVSMAMGAVLTFAAVAVFGYLAFWAAMDFVGASPRPR
jgi:hypothetical protein